MLKNNDIPRPSQPRIRRIRPNVLLFAVIIFGLAAGWYYQSGYSVFHWPIPQEFLGKSPVEEIPENQRKAADLILLGARQEAAQGTRYDASYAVIDYPGGDVPADRGACTDVVIRAFRNAGIDLQELIHEDMGKNFDSYPQKWGIDAPDSNIDHRRVPNQIQFFKTHGKSLTLEVEEHLNEWKWGDVVYWRFADGRDHCGIISDRTTRVGRPLVIHNAGMAREEDALLRWEIIGHYRYSDMEN